MNKTRIEWCDCTWNPVTGCYHTCPYCYARTIATRFAGRDRSFDYLDINKSVNGKLVNEMYMPTKRRTKSGGIQIANYPYGFEPTFHRYRLNEPQKKTKPQTIFVCSMADLFGEWVPNEWIEAVFEACEKAPQHRYLFLTKNPERYKKLYLSGKLPLNDNVWYGATITNPTEIAEAYNAFTELDRNINTFFSVEPLCMDIDDDILPDESFWWYSGWVVIGAETGNNKNKIVPKKEWIYKIASDCDDEYVPVFMKDSLLPIVGKENMRREFPWD